jgi:hypothetical protein
MILKLRTVSPDTAVATACRRQTFPSQAAAGRAVESLLLRNQAFPLIA